MVPTKLMAELVRHVDRAGAKLSRSKNGP
jgi:hypothetical protein